MIPQPTDELIDAPNREPLPEGHAVVEIAGRLVTVKTTPPPPRRRMGPEAPSMVPRAGVADGSMRPRHSALSQVEPAPSERDRVPQDLNRDPAWLALVACVALVATFAAVLFLG